MNPDVCDRCDCCWEPECRHGRKRPDCPCAGSRSNPDPDEPLGPPMTDHDHDPHIDAVPLPIMGDASVDLYASGRVTVSTSDDAADLDDHDIAALADLLTWAQGLRNGTIQPSASTEPF